MSRISYSEDEEFAGQFELWRANLRRSIHGRKGQAALRDLRDALVAMPVKRLIAGHLVKGNEVCANGALVVAKRAMKESKTVEQVMAEIDRELWERAGCAGCYHRRRDHTSGASVQPEGQAALGLDIPEATATPKFDGGCVHCERTIAEMQADVLAGKQWHWTPSLCVAFEEPDPEDEYDEMDDEGETEAAAVAVGMPRMVAWRLVELNDVTYDAVSPEERYDKILAWVEKALSPTTPDYIIA